MYGDEGLLDAVTRWRMPEVAFDSFAEGDLGDRVVQLWHTDLCPWQRRGQRG
jgi:cyclase